MTSAYLDKKKSSLKLLWNTYLRRKDSIIDIKKLVFVAVSWRMAGWNEVKETLLSGPGFFSFFFFLLCSHALKHSVLIALLKTKIPLNNKLKSGKFWNDKEKTLNERWFKVEKTFNWSSPSYIKLTSFRFHFNVF